MGSTTFAGGLRSWPCLCCQENTGKGACQSLPRAPAPHSCSHQHIPSLRWGRLPGAPMSWTVCSMEPALPPRFGTRVPLPPRGTERAEQQGRAAAHTKAPAPAGLSTEPVPGPYRRRWPEPQQPRGSGMGTARSSAGTWPEAWAEIRQRLRLPFHSQWLLHQTHWWAEISAGF